MARTNWIAALALALGFGGMAAAAPPGLRNAARHGYVGGYFPKMKLAPTAKLRAGKSGKRGGTRSPAGTAPGTAALGSRFRSGF